jgi:apolipoprotein N-acyltransferase
MGASVTKDSAREDDETSSVLSKTLVAGIGGAMAAMGWLPPHVPVFMVLGLGIIFYVCRNARTTREVVSISFFGAMFFFVIVNRPLVSAYGWGGWSDSGGMSVGSSGWWLLNGLWLLISVWGALFWVFPFVVYWWLRTEKTWLRMVVTVAVWIGVAEWLRSFTHWNFEWGFLGIALVDVAMLRQWVSIFGVLFLSGMIAGGSILAVELVSVKLRHKIVLAIVGVVIGAGLWFGGRMLMPDAAPNEPVQKVAAFQFSPPVPPAGTSALGVSDLWFPALSKIVENNYQLIVLPESISSRAIELDNVVPPHFGVSRRVAADKWKQVFSSILRQHPDTFIAMGTETVEQGAVFNSTSIWDKEGLVGWQHKIHLVPFAEYLPGGWGFMGTQAVTYYQSGKNYLPVAAGDFQIGSFICQEVQHADAARSLVRKGANILVTGGNDGVFADHRVAQIHHSMARIRATETGRYLVRAMKSGITSIISPVGEVVGQSPGSGSVLVAAKVGLKNDRTFWVRFGNWPILLFVLPGLSIFLLTLVRGTKKHG